MRIGGHSLREHLRLLAPLFGLIAGVWVLRAIMDFARTPPDLVRLVSVSVAASVSVLIAVVLIHFRRFGGYSSVVAATFLLTLWEELLIVLAIAFATLTGTANVYVAPQYGGLIPPWRHILGHLTFGIGLGTIFGAAMGCLLLWLLRKLAPVVRRNQSRAY